MSRYVAVFSALALAIGLAGRHAYVTERQNVEAGLRALDEEIANVQATRLAAWRNERVGDATTVETAVLLMPAVQDAVRGGAPAAVLTRVLMLLDTLRTNYQYATVSLLDARGREVLTSGERLDSGRYRDLTREAAQAFGVVLHETPGPAGGSGPRLTLAIALRHEDRDDQAPFGAIVLAVNPQNALSPPIVTRIDGGHAAASLAQTRTQILIAAGLLTLLCALSLGLIYRHQRSTFYRQQYEAEAERQALRGHYDYLTRYANDALLLTDDDSGRILEVNDRAIEMYGYGRDEMLRMCVRDLRSAESLPSFDAQWSLVRERGSLVFEVEQRAKDGRAFPVEVSTRVIRTGSGVYRQSSMRDITERKRAEQAEEALRVSRERGSLVLDAMEEGYWDRNVVTGAAYVSPRTYTMLGYVPGEVPSDWDWWVATVHPDDRARIDASVGVLEGAGDAALALEYRARCKSGQYIWIRSRGKTVERDADGRAVRRVGTVTDITEQKKLESHVQQAQKLESVGRLAGSVAHDFNNLLTIINGYSDLILSQTDVGGPHQARLQAIRDAGGRAAALTEQLLTFSRRQIVEPRIFGLNAVVGDVDGLLQRMAGDHVRLVSRLTAAPDLVLADPSQLHQVVMNLVVNARDAMPDGGVIEISTSNASIGGDDVRDAPPGPYLCLSVRDTGIGMNDETRAQIFEPFFTTKEKGKGTGLGLSTVYGIVRQNGGFIRVDSEPGVGTVFNIYLPATAERRAEDRPPAAAPRLVGGSETILVVEHDDAVRAMAVDALTSLGYAVLAAPGGSAALHLADVHPGPIDLLVTDLSMPDMGGSALVGALTAKRPPTKVLFVDKPFTRRSLGTAVRSVLGEASVELPGSRPSLLLVDDDESIRGLVPELLQDDYDVLLAADGAEAVEIVRQTPALDVILTDLFMPNMEGFELIRKARALRPGIRIVAMSGAFGGDFLAGAGRAGADATLRKPIAVETLRATLGRVRAGSGIA